MIEVGIGELISFLAFILALASGFGKIIWDMSQKIIANSKELHAKLDAVDKDLTDFQLEVAHKYVNSEHLAKLQSDLIRTEERTLGAINALTERLDRFLTQRE